MKNFDWSKLVTKPVPQVVAHNDDWLTSDSAQEFFKGIARATGKNLTEQLLKLTQQDVESAEDLLYLTEDDFHKIGVDQLGLKLTVKRYLAERKAKKAGAGNQ